MQMTSSNQKKNDLLGMVMGFSFLLQRTSPRKNNVLADKLMHITVKMPIKSSSDILDNISTFGRSITLVGS